VTAVLVIAGHVSVADPAIDDTRTLALADVICSACPGDWLTDFPGCALAVAYSGDLLLAATRTDSVSVRGNPIIGGIFLYGWMTAGLPLGLLGGYAIETSSETPGHWPASFSVLIEDRRADVPPPQSPARRARCTRQRRRPDDL